MMKWVTRNTRRFAVLAAIALGAGLSAPLMAATPPGIAREEAIRDQLPLSLVITYRTSASQRPDFREYLVNTMAARLRAMKADRRLEDFRILYSWYRQPAVWDAMVVLRFPDAAAVKAWNALEAKQPGGLDERGIALANPVGSYLSDLEWSAKPDELDKNSVYYVIPYSYEELGLYSKYLEGYVLPQFSGWMKDGALSGFEIYMNRYAVGEPWDALFIQHYRDIDAFGRRQALSTKVRATLKDDPVWKEWSENKQKIRSETENTIAELIAY